MSGCTGVNGGDDDEGIVKWVTSVNPMSSQRNFSDHEHHDIHYLFIYNLHDDDIDEEDSES